MKPLLTLLFATALQAVTTVYIPDSSATSTQALIRVNTDQGGNCTIRASQGAAIGTLVFDVDTTKFAGSNSDSRTGSIVTGRDHLFVLGTRKAMKASDGKWYSRALQANTQHTVEVTCGTDVITQSFYTRNPPLGDIAGETIPFDSTAPYNAALPSIDLSMTNNVTMTMDTGQGTPIIDPLSGIKALRITGAMQDYGVQNFNPGTPPTAFDTASAWTTPTKAVGNSGVATISTAGAANALFVPFGIPEKVNYGPFGGWPSVRYQLDDMNASFSCVGSDAMTSANRQLSACLTLHHGAGCDSDTFTTIQCPSGSPAVQYFPGNSGTDWLPTWKRWTVTNPQIPASIDLGTRTGTATMSGTTITWASGTNGQLFPNRLSAGDRIYLQGSGCGNGGTDYCTVARVTDSKHIVTTESNTVSPAANYTIQNAGLRIWKNTNNGTVNLNQTQWYGAFGLGHGVGANEQKDLCSPNTFTLTANRDGSARSTNVPARLCQFQATDGVLSTYVFVPSTGEAWHIANSFIPAGGSGLDSSL